MPLFISLSVVVFVLLTPAAFAGEVGYVQGVQMPAWVDRDNERLAIRPGDTVYSSDQVHTGSGGRLLIEMLDGGAVKLGEAADFEFRGGAEPERGLALAGVMRVLSGAFRYTTGIFSSRPQRRELDISIGAITAGVRGTDVWGRSQTERDLVCLLEGKIAVSSAGSESQLMDSPLTFYVVPKGEQALPISPVDQEKLPKWAAMTELDQGAGVLSQQGRWGVNLGSFQKPQGADREQSRLNELGYAANVVAAQLGSQQWYRVQVNGFNKREDALAFAADADEQLGVSGAWIYYL